MNIYLGNLTIEEIEQRLGFELKDSERKLFKDTWQPKADISAGVREWHCFDIPFLISCGSMDFATEVHDILSPYSKQFKGQIQIGVR